MKLTRGILTLALLLPLAACGDDDPAGPGNAVLVGTWNVTELEGQTVPHSETFEEEGFSCTYTLSSLKVTFNSAGTFNGSEVSNVKCAGLPEENTSASFNGTYSVSGDRITMTQDFGDGPETEVNRFTVSGNTLTLFEGTTGTERLVVAVRQ